MLHTETGNIINQMITKEIISAPTTFGTQNEIYFLRSYHFAYPYTIDVLVLVATHIGAYWGMVKTADWNRDG